MLLTLVLTIAGAMTITFCCNLLEACTLSLSSTDIAKISEHRPKVAAIWKRFKQNIEKPIAVILILNTLAHTIGASLGGGEFTELFGSRWVVVFSLAFSFAMVEWTELLPKSLGVKHNRRVARWAALPLSWIVPVVSPVLQFLELLNRPFVGRPNPAREPNTVDDIRVLAEFAAVNNQLSRDQAMILSRTVNLSRLRVQDAMVGKEDIRSLTTAMSLADALVYAHVHQHTRLPLADAARPGEFLGYVNFKDIVSALRINPADPSLRGICRPMLTLQADETLAAALGKLTSGYQHIAAVKDRQGATVGIVTMEDVIEMIIGDVEDEYDVLPAHVFQIAPDRYVAGGGVRMQVLRERIPCLPEAAGSLPLNDWLRQQCGRTPKAGEELAAGGCRFTVRKICRSNVAEVIVEAGVAGKRTPGG